MCLRKALETKKESKFLKRLLCVTAFVKCIETSRRDRAVSEDTGELKCPVFPEPVTYMQYMFTIGLLHYFIQSFLHLFLHL